MKTVLTISNEDRLNSTTWSRGEGLGGKNPIFIGANAIGHA